MLLTNLGHYLDTRDATFLFFRNLYFGGRSGGSKVAKNLKNKKKKEQKDTLHLNYTFCKEDFFFLKPSI